MSQEEEFVTPRVRKVPVYKTDTELALEEQFPGATRDADAGQRQDDADEVPTP